MLVSQLPNNIPILSACLKEAGHDVKLFDTTLYRTTEKTNDEIRVERMQVRKFNINEAGITINENDVLGDFKKTVEQYKPDLIGITVVEDTFDMALTFMASIQDYDVPVILGGVHVTLNPDEVLSNELVNLICIGEGEEALVELVTMIEQKKPYDSIPGIWSKKSDGTIIRMGVRKLININSIPYEDFSIFPPERIFRPMQGKMVASLPINFDKGCPYQCTFCAAPQLSSIYRTDEGQRYFRKKTNERIKSEIDFFLSHYPVKYFYFNSETFLSMPIKQFEEFASLYSEYKIPFWCQTHVQSITEEKLILLKEMGVDRISLGIEHGNEEFRKKMLGKHFTNNQAIFAMTLLRKHSVPVSTNNIIGLPDETRELIFDTIELNRTLQADGVSGLVFQPYKGTYLYKYCKEKGYIESDLKVDSPMGSSILTMPTISKLEIEGLLRTFVLYVKLPRDYWPEIQIAESLGPEGDKKLNELREILFNDYFK